MTFQCSNLTVTSNVSQTVTVTAQRLVGFTRIRLGAGQAKTAQISFPASALAQTQGDINASGPPTVEPGSYVVQIDKNTTTPYEVEASAPFTVS